MKKIILAVFLISGLASYAQEKATESNLSLGVDVQSRYIWRGLQLGGASPSIQPSVEYASGKFAFGAWGAYATGGINKFQETDLYMSLAASETLSFTVTDYFFPEEGALNSYFNYGDATGHVYELMLSFSGTKSFPIGFTVATNFAGASTGSTYVETNYSKKVGEVEYSLFAGAVFGDNDGYYLTDGSGLINLGMSVSKEIKITDSFSLPVNAALIFNPDQENIYLTFGFSL